MDAPAIDFRLAFEASPDVLLVLLPDAPRFTMVAATRARFEATHMTQDMLGKGLFEIFPDNPDDPQATGTSNLRASLERVIATRAPDTMAVQKYDIRLPDGTFTTKYWSPKNIPVLSPSGELVYVLHRVEDVTALVEASELGQAKEREVVQRSRELAAANDSLREANTKLGELDAAKTAFFGNVSHEFRTPLTLMLGPLADALESTSEPLGATQRARIELAHDNALRLLKLVNALLEFSRVEAGRVRAKHAPLDLSAQTAKLAGMFQSAFDKARIRLIAELPVPSVPAWVDREMWEKIVLNLVSNAFKFTLEGSITIRMREEDDAFVLEVADTGVGIPKQELPFVFDRFHRVAGTTGRTHEGTGIGLALVRELTELHGGHVSVESELGVGTTFRVTMPKGFAHLPPDSVSMTAEGPETTRDASAHATEAARWVETAPVPHAEPDAHRDGARARVLIVDDNADLREYMSSVLGAHYEVRVAENGRVGLEAARAWRPDIVVSDVMMPLLDGIGLARALRADPATRSLPVILLSARAGDDASVEGLDAGADDYVLKPFSARELLARVRTHVDLSSARRTWALELERANQELEAFSYAVSHDLRAPLRSIDGFSRILTEDHAMALDADGKRVLSRIGNATHVMSELIEGLLELSKIARVDVENERVDLGALAADVVADLRRAHPDRSVRVDVAEGMFARGDRRLLRVALVNLIGNAWKFTSRRDQAHIEIGRGPDDAFFVRDNGAGFDMAYAQRLFTPFQRLHPSGEFEGTGVGLSTVQRVVRRLHGDLWAEAAVDHGATFYFTLPAA